MEKKQIHSYLIKKGIRLDQRVSMDGGGQYLDNFLIDFEKFIREDLINQQIRALKELKTK